MEVNQRTLAECLGITSRQARNLKAEGILEPLPSGKKYCLEKCVREYIDFKVKSETGRRTSITKEEVQAEHEKIKKQISIMKLRKLRRETHEAADVELFLRDMLLSFKNQLMELPVKLAVQLVGQNDINEVAEVITQEIKTALKTLQEYDPEKLDSLKGTGSETEDELEEDEGEDGEDE